MEKLSKERIIDIANGILEENDIIALHGTNIKNAYSIMQTGFYFDKTSMAMLKSKNLVSLCHYGWKNNEPGDSANIIIAISQSFIKMLTNFDDDDYANWIEKIRKNDCQEDMMIYISNVVEYKKSLETKKWADFPFPRLPDYEKRHISKEFIKGCFIYCDNKRYLDFLSNREESLNHLSYVENPCFFDNLSYEEQIEFVQQFHENLKSKAK